MKLESQGGKIKPAGHQHDFTPHQVQELFKCKNDPIYFIRNYVRIQGNKGPSLFKLYDYQELMIQNYLKYDRVITMTSRQVGKSVTTLAFILWWACFRHDQFIIIAANKGKTAVELMRRFTYMYEELPWWLKPGCVKNNVMSMEFDNKCIVTTETTTTDTGRGFAVHLLFCDEFAYVAPNIQEEFYSSIAPTVTGVGGRMIITSTPNTDEDKFASIWFNAIETENSWEWKDRILEMTGHDGKEKEEKYDTVYEDPSMDKENDPVKIDPEDDDGEFGFRRFFVHWKAHPDRDDSFKRKTLAEGTSYDKWLREFEAQFVSADATLIDPARLMLLSHTIRKPKFIDRHGVKWFRNILPNKSHAVTLDPAEGVGGDNSVIQVWSLPDLKQVAEWASNEADQVEQTRMLLRILKRIYTTQQDSDSQYGDSEIYYSVECNGQGMGVLNIIEVEGEDKFPGELIDSEGNKKRGLLTTERSKRDYCLQIKKMIEREMFTPASRDLVSELKNFCKTGKSFKGKGNSKDDRVMSCVLMCHMLEELKYHEDGLEDAMHVDISSGEVDGEDEDEGYGIVI